jgi:hypothetical protein
MADEMTTGNGNGYTTKDVLNRLEGKVDTFIATHTQQHTELMEVVQKLATDLAIHQADEHPKKVAELHDAGQRELGRRDMLRILFGTSVAGALLGAAGLAMNVVDKLNGN